MVKGYFKYLKSKWLLVLILIPVLFVLYYYGTFLYASTFNDVAIGSMQAWKSHESADFSDDKITLLKNDYGVENITQTHTTHVTFDFQVHAIESTFIDNGVDVNHPNYWQIIEKVKLINGEVWDYNTTDKVIILDEATAIKFYGHTDVVNQFFDIDGELWEIIGVVSNTSSRVAKYKERLDPYGNQFALDDFDTDVYVPFSFCNYEKFDFHSEEPYTIIVNTGKLLSTNKDRNHVIDLIAEENNYIVQSDNNKYTVIAVAVADSYGLHNFNGYFIMFLLPFIIVLMLHVINQYQQSDKVRVREYNNEDEDRVLNLQPNNKTDQETMKEILGIYNDRSIISNLYVVELNEHIVGLCLVKIEEAHQHALISEFIIDNEFQGRGVGKKAIRKILSHLESLSLTITTTTKKDNFIARILLENSGFTILNDDNDEYLYKYKS